MDGGAYLRPSAHQRKYGKYLKGVHQEQIGFKKHLKSKEHVKNLKPVKMSSILCQKFTPYRKCY